jgi:hypothetical protein
MVTTGLEAGSFWAVHMGGNMRVPYAWILMQPAHEQAAFIIQHAKKAFASLPWYVPGGLDCFSSNANERGFKKLVDELGSIDILNIANSHASAKVKFLVTIL